MYVFEQVHTQVWCVFSGSIPKLKSSGFLAGSQGINQLKNNFQLSENLHDELDFPGEVFDV